MKHVPRPNAVSEIRQVLRENPVCALLGPRQCGKTTLALDYAGTQTTHVFDMESDIDRRRLADPDLALAAMKGLVVIEEVQRMPKLFESLRPLADRRGSKTKFLLLGSASPELMKGVSETLAGRIGFVRLGGFSIAEAGAENLFPLWLRGGFPRSFLAAGNAASMRWRQNFVDTFLERDLPVLGIRSNTEMLRRFWTMTAHYHGQIWNGAEIARSLNVSESTVRSFLDIMSGAFVLRVLRPWFANISKRQVKSPKVYVRDTGILHTLLNVPDRVALDSHPKVGASWEGFALEHVLNVVGERDAYFWSTQAGAELDLVFLHRGKLYGVEFKRSSAPAMTKSLYSAFESLNLEHAWIVYPGQVQYAVAKNTDVLPLTEAATVLRKFRS